MALAEARTLTFAHRRKIFLVSTPTIQGVSRIEREYLASDQRRFFVPCPHCGAMQWLRFERLRWDKGQPETAAYWCEACERPIAERHKAADAARPAAGGPTADRGRPADRGLPPLRPLRAAGLAELGADRRPARAGARGRRDPPRLRQRGPGRDLGRDRRQPGLAAAVRAARGLAAWAPCRRAGSCWPPVPTCSATGSRSSIWAWGHGKACWLVEHRVLIGRARPAAGLAGALGPAGRELAPRLRRRAEAGGAGHRQRLCHPGGLWLGTDAAGRAGVRAQGGRARRGAGRPADRGRRLARRQAAAPRRQGADRGHRPRQARAVQPSAPAGARSTASRSRRATSTCPGSMPSSSSSSAPSSWSPGATGAATPGASGRRPASATRRSTATSTPAPQLRSSASTA